MLRRPGLTKPLMGLLAYSLFFPVPLGAQATSPDPSSTPKPSASSRPAVTGSPASVKDREWFSRNGKDPSFGDELLRAAESYQDPRQAALLLGDYWPALTASAHRMAVASWLAAHAELYGGWDIAASWYAKALAVQDKPELRLRHAICLAKAGECASALASLRVLPPSSSEARSSGRIVKAWCLAAMDRGKEGLEEALAIAADPALRDIHAQALYLAAILDGSVDDPLSKGARAALLKGWPTSPEAAAAVAWGGGTRVQARPDPLLLLSAISGWERDASPASPSPATATAPPPSPVTGPRASPVSIPSASTAAMATPQAADSWPTAYQVGYFSKVDNARNLLAELRGKGFPALISERKARDGSARWVVSVPSGADAQDLFLRLSEAGYDLYPLWD